MVRDLALALSLALTFAGEAAAADWARAGGGLLIGQDAGAASDGPEAEPITRTAGQPFDEQVSRAAALHGLDPKLLHAVIIVESAYQPGAVSPAGAAGLTQLMPATAEELGVVDRFDVEESLSGGARYLAQQIARFGDIRLALAAYNSGPGRVSALGRTPFIKETQRYVATVVDCYLALAAGRSPRTAAACRSEGRAP